MRRINTEDNKCHTEVVSLHGKYESSIVVEK